MPKIAVCYKWVIDEADIKAEGGALSFKQARHVISLYDRNAIEAAVQLREKYGGSVVAISVGTDEVKESRKDVLSRGPDEAIFVCDPSLENADNSVTARVLAAAIKKLDRPDIIICGEGASDDYSQQVGPRMAQRLGIPVISYVSHAEPGDSRITAERTLEDGVEKVEAPLPVLLTIMGSAYTPRLASLKEIMGASKKPFRELKLAELDLGEKPEPRTKTIKMSGVVVKRKNIIFKGSPEESVAEAIKALGREGVLK